MALPKLSHAAHPRPFATYYYEAVRHAEKDWSRVGRASSMRGAIRAAVGHIIDGKYSSCVSEDLNLGGVCVARVYRRGRDIAILGVFLPNS
jgi:hypothetical protein